MDPNGIEIDGSINFQRYTSRKLSHKFNLAYFLPHFLGSNKIRFFHAPKSKWKETFLDFSVLKSTVNFSFISLIHIKRKLEEEEK